MDWEIVECTPQIDWSMPEAQPTTIEPGPSKVELLARRYERGPPLHIDGDKNKRSEAAWGIWNSAPSAGTEHPKSLAVAAAGRVVVMR